VERNRELLATPPESSEWQREAEHYNINTSFVPLGRYNGLHLFPVLRRFCASDLGPPVYLDEVAAVFVRRRPENEDLIARLGIQCAAAPLPAVVRNGDTTEAFNSWARDRRLGGATALLPYPAPELLALGYAELAARHPQKALQQFARAAASLPPQHERKETQRFFASLAHGRAMALSALGKQH
jgi:hypothetical protein